MTYTTPNRGAALIIVIVLLACLALVAGAVLPQILRERHESRQDLIRVQSRQLLDDALHNAEAKRRADPEFSGVTFVLDSENQPFSGVFQVTTTFVNEAFTGKVEYQNKEGKIIYAVNR
ncbi:MAG: hypothetical protein FWE95_07725 [Planctomycetaceae bacterium]|nr:hypothetical protein [Planctomycetaceae bacterium]